MPVDETQMQELFQRLGVENLQQRGLLREFMSLPSESQLAWLFIEMQNSSNGASSIPKAHVMQVIYTTLAFLAALAAGGDLQKLPLPVVGWFINRMG